MAIRENRSSRGIWLIALAITLVLHVLTILGFHVFRPFTPSPVQARTPDPIELVFAEPAPQPTPDKPTFFSELPPDRADETPDRADFLSNVDSRARDQVAGGDQALPRMEGEGDAPQVAMNPAGGPSAPPSVAEPPVAPPVDREGETPAPDAAPAQEPPRPGEKAAAQKTPEEQRRAREQSALLLQRPTGRSDFFQPEMSHPEGNAQLSGDISLNTVAWDYAPWLQRFRRTLMEHWFAPTAYYMGILKEGGWELVEVEVAPSGEILRIDLLEEQGHPSLTQASLGALKSTAPLQPLPANFPEDSLVLRIRMIYPKVPTR